MYWFADVAAVAADDHDGRVVCLLVEDDDDTRAVVTDLLLAHDIHVLAASDADAAIAQADAAFDVAVIDLGLPNVDGLSLCESLRRTRAHVGAVAYTGFSSLTRSARAAGFDAMVVKPFDAPALVDVVRRGAALGRVRRRAAEG